MARICISHGGAVSNYFFETDAEARAVYDKVKQLVDAYDRFRNKDGETVEFGTDKIGSLATHRLSDISSISINFGDECPDWFLEVRARGLANDERVRRRADEIGEAAK